MRLAKRSLLALLFLVATVVACADGQPVVGGVLDATLADAADAAAQGGVTKNH